MSEKTGTTHYLPKGAIEWLANGDRGISSETIFEAMTGIPCGESRSHPHDPDDLTRCVLLFEEVPEFAKRIHEMAKVSQEWAALVPIWDKLTATLDEEAPGWRDGGRWSAKKTYAMMRAAIAKAKGA